MNGQAGRGFARGMDGLDGGLSVRCMGGGECRLVAAAEQREAASGSEAVVKSDGLIIQTDRGGRFYDCFAAERSLASSTAATADRGAQGVSRNS